MIDDDRPSWDVGEDEIVEDGDDRSIRFKDETMECPGCGAIIDSDHDSCPMCGDILFRYMKDGSFVPKKGLLSRVFAGIVAVLVILCILGMLLSAFSIL